MPGFGFFLVPVLPEVDPEPRISGKTVYWKLQGTKVGDREVSQYRHVKSDTSKKSELNIVGIVPGKTNM